MELSKLDRINNAWERLAHQFPRWPTTYSTCRSCKNNGARGFGPCTSCSLDELAALIGEAKAREVHDTMKSLNELWYKLYDEFSGDAKKN